ncbi:MAG: M28 family peptidase [Clostridia bacterium]|nr:M28 family peptidase [Clostridia bacterium]
MDFLNEIVSRFPVRKSEKQKQAFRDWAVEQAEAMGYAVRVETYYGSKTTRNVVIGDPDKAQVLFTAHYDTPARSFLPNMMFLRPGMMLLYSLLVIGAFLGISFGLGAGVGLLLGEKDFGKTSRLIAMLIYWVLLVGMLLGPANKNNVNDNTSGVTAVFALMERLPAELRSRAAFVLFDNEEKGLVGSKVFAKQHKAVKENTPVINLDCVGDGENIIMAVNKKARALPVIAELEKIMQETDGRAFVMSRKFNMLGSDHRHFNLGVMTCACKHHRLMGYYADKIHTSKDTVCDEANITYLAEGLSRFVAALPEEA